LLGAPFVAGTILAVVYGIHRLMKSRGREPKLPPNWKLLYAYALFGCLLHILMDFTNNYGVRPFAPFYPRWYSWDIFFIIDPYILAALLLGLVAPALIGLITEEIGGRRPQFRGRGGAIFALVFFLAWIGLRDVEHRRAVNALNSLVYRNQEPLRASAFPLILDPFSWNGVVETQDFFEIVAVDSTSGEVDSGDSAVVRYKPEETPVSLAAKRSRVGQVYLDWAQYPVLETEKLPDEAGYQVQFEDLRFSYITSLARRRAPPLAAYAILDRGLHVVDAYFGRPNGADGRGK
jgi:inner membrane protein